MTTRKTLIATFGTTLLAAAAILPQWSSVGADGTEELGAPSVPIANGSGIIVAGVGLEDAQPETLSVDVPAGSSVEQVLLYWEGQNDTATGDDTIVVDGNTATGTLIGGPTRFFTNVQGNFYSSTYRADITALGLISAGPNTLSVGGLTFDQVTDGAGISVVYDDGTDSELAVFDGNDLAFINFPSPRDTTVPKTFTFAAAATARTATLSMHFSSVAGPAFPGERPSIIDVTVGGVTTEFANLLTSADGNEWDAVTVDVAIPAGATELTVQALSANANGDGQNPLAASFVWNAAGLSVPVPPPPPTTDNTPPITTVPPTTLPPTTVPPTTDNAPPVTTVPPTTLEPVPQTTTPPDPTTTLTPSGILPETGSGNSRLPLGTGGIALAAGVALILVARRRPTTTS